MRKMKKKIVIRDNNEIQKTTATSLRSGGMQERLHRQELIRYGNAVEEHKNKMKRKEKKSRSFSIQSFKQEVESLDDFREPVFRKIRSKWGFS